MSKSSKGAAARPAWAAVLLAACLLTALPASAAALDAEHLPAIQAATFEVVAAKPVDDPLDYEKPLPLDQIPFQQRNDKYHSIGTAFSIGGGRYVTAAHVLLTGVNSLWGEPALRDNTGKVYAIDKVHKFSQEKDFVVFSLVEQPPGEPLVIAPKQDPGRAVYSVGNAYGTGVVIRDGLYTSDTPEQQDGRWNWMPISTVIDAPDGVGSTGQRIGYQCDASDSTITDTLKTSFKLPLPPARFFAESKQRTNAWCDQRLGALLAQERDRGRLFGEGTGS